ncbi:MAG: alpha/beta hydrolase-fold protein [Thermoanaerobaculia bacterium]
MLVRRRWRQQFAAVAALLLAIFATTAASAREVSIGESFVLKSAILHEDRRYEVALPASYAWAEDRRYPVLFVLDGADHFAHSAASVAYLADKGDIPEMIVVAIDSTVRVRDFTQTDWSSHWIGGGGAAKFREFLANEMLPTIDRTYRTQPFRVLSGHSAGGQFVLWCLPSDRPLFQAYVALSPSLDWDDGLPIRDLEKGLRSVPDLSGFVYVARSDDFGGALADFEKLVAVLRSGAPAGLRVKSAALPLESHTTIPLLGQIDALRSLYEGWRLPEDLVDQGVDATRDYFAALSKKLGIAVPLPESALNDLGYAALGREQFAQAIALFEENVRANPGSANARDSAADGYLAAGDLPAAKASADRAVELAKRFRLSNLAAFERTAQRVAERMRAAEAGTAAPAGDAKP